MYIELHAASGFSFLEGASQPEDLVAEAARLGHRALALCDRDGVFGAPRFYKAAAEAGVRPLVGCEISLADAEARVRPSLSSQGIGTRHAVPDGMGDSACAGGGREPGPVPAGVLREGAVRRAPTEDLDPRAGVTLPPRRLTVLVENRRGYQNLCRLLTRMHLRAPKGEGRAAWDDIEAHAGGLVALLSDLRDAGRLLSIFGSENLYVEVQRHFLREQEQANRSRIDYARRHRLPLLATNGVRYARKSGRPLLDALTAIRQKTVLDRAGRLLDANAERHLKPPAEMARLFADLPEAARNTEELAARLEFTLRDLGYKFPDYPVPPGETQMSYLWRLAEQGARERYRPYHERARRQIEHELRIIEKLGLAGYFLIVWDMARFCRESKILAQGRGSAANSAVCYSLGITAVDPVGMELLFERFLSEERGEWPDIDLDLPSGDQREKAVQYVYERYGERGAAMTANVITYRGRSAVREIGKVLGFPEEMIDRLAKCIHSFEYTDDGDRLQNQIRVAGFDASHPRLKHFVRLCRAIQNLPRHLGQHSGGMVICGGRLDSIVPLENARMPGRVVVQWDKDDCADLGIIKVDLLGLGMIAALEESIEILRSRGKEIDLAHLPPDDPQTYQMIQKADTVGVFQIESRAQMATLPRLRPVCFYDLVVEVAIIRPGPIVGNMVHPYINRRLGREPVSYPHPSLEPILKRTLGVPLFQEQLLRLAMTAAGFTGGEAEELRRAMGFKRSAERMKAIEENLRRGLARNRIHGQAAEEIIRSITSFALYGFPESHAASFALLAYASAYLKAHYPEAFLAALLNCQPMGFYSPAVLVKDAQRHGVRVRSIDVNRSDVKCKLEDEVSNAATQAPEEIRREKSAVGGSRIGAKEPLEGVAIPTACRAPADGHAHSAARAPSVRLGLMFVSGLRAEAAQRIEQERRRRRFASVDDLVRRVNLRKPELDVLAEIGALNSLGKGMHRREALWQIEKAWRPKGPLFEEQEEEEARASGSRLTKGDGVAMRQAEGTACRAPTDGNAHRAGPGSADQHPSDSRPTGHGSRFTAHGPMAQPLNSPTDPCPLPPMTPLERLDADYRGSGMTTGPHPMHYLREPLNGLGVLPATQLERYRHGARVRVAGAVIVRQRPGTAKGFLFLTLEDETGVSNIIVRPKIFENNRVLLTSEPFLLVEGILQRQDHVTSVRAETIKPLGNVTLEMASHDFH